MLIAGTPREVQLGHVIIRKAAGFPAEYRLDFKPSSLNVVSPPTESSTTALAGLLRTILRPEGLEGVVASLAGPDGPLAIEATLATSGGVVELHLSSDELQLQVGGEMVYEGTDRSVLRSALENTLGRQALEAASELYCPPAQVTFRTLDTGGERPPVLRALLDARDELHRIQEHLGQYLAQNAAREQRGTLQQKRRKMEGQLQHVREHEGRLADLQQRLEGDYAHLAGQTERLQIDLHYLSMAEKDLKKAQEALQATVDRAGQLDEQYQELKGRVEVRFPQMVGLDVEYPRWQRRYHDLKAILGARKSECERLQRELLGLRERLQNRYSSFLSVPDDFEVKLGAFTAIREETRHLLVRLDEEISVVSELESERAAINEQMTAMPHFLSCTDDFPERLKELLGLRLEVVERQNTIDTLSARAAALRKRVTESGVDQERPLDFPEKLHYLRTQQNEWRRQLRELQEHWTEQQELASHETELLARLHDFEDLPDQGQAFMDRLNSLFTARQELDTTAASVADVEERLQALDGTIATQFASFAGLTDSYLDQVEDVKGSITGLRNRQGEIDIQLARREELSAELAAAESALSERFADLEKVPSDFPGKLHEYFRLQGVHTRLMAESEDLQGRIAPLEKRLEEEFAPFAHLTRYRFRLRRLRAHDELLRNLLHHLEWEIKERRQTESRIAEMRPALEGVGDAPALDDHQVVLMLQSQALKRELAEQQDRQQELEGQLAEQRKVLLELANALGYADLDYAVQLEGSSERLERLEHLKIVQIEWRGAERVSEALTEWVTQAEQAVILFDAQQASVKSTASLTPLAIATLQVYQAEVTSLREELEEAEKAVLAFKSKSGKFFGGGRAETGNEQTAHVAALKAALERARGRLTGLLKEHGLEGSDIKAMAQQVDELRQASQKRADLVTKLETCQLLLALANTDTEQRREAFAEEARLLGLDTADDAPDRLMVEIREFSFRREQLAQLVAQKKHVDNRVDELEGLQKGAQSAPAAADVESTMSIHRRKQELESLEARLLLLRPFAEIERIRSLLVQQVAASIEEMGLEKSLVDTEDRAGQYLEYQQVLAELEDLKAVQDQLLNRSGSGNDMARIEQKLAQLRKVLPEHVMGTPLEDNLKRWQEFADMREAVMRLARSLAEVPGIDSLQGEKTRLEARIRSELGRVGVEEESGLAERVAQYHQWRTMESERRGLDNILKRRLHVEVRADGTLETDLDRLKARLSSLREAVGRWGERVQTNEDLESVSRRWREGREVGADLAGVRRRLSELPSAESLQQRIEQLHQMTRDKCQELGVPEDEGKDDELLRTWRAGINLEDELRSVEEQRTWEMQEKPGPDGTAETIIERLQRRIKTLEGLLGPFQTVTDPEPVLNEFKTYTSLSQRRDRCVRQLGEHKSPEALKDGRQSAVERLNGLAGELVLPNVDVEADSVLEQYRGSLQLRAEIRTLAGMLDKLTGAREGDDQGLDALQREADDLEKRLGERAKVVDTDAEIGLFADYQKEMEAVNKLRDQRDAILAAGPKRAVRQAEELVREAQERIGPWIRERDTAQVLGELVKYQEVQNELNELEMQGRGLVASDVLRKELDGIDTSLANLPAIDDSVNLLSAIAESRLREAQTRSKVLEAEEAVQSAGLSLDALESDGACVEKASAYLARVTSGAWKRLLVTTDQGVRLEAVDGTRTGLGGVSMAVREMAGLSWQLALLDELGPGSPLPWVVEELSSGDTAAHQTFAGLLQELGEKRQILLVTPPADSEEKASTPQPKGKGKRR